jgi:hypothetical protein
MLADRFPWETPFSHSIQPWEKGIAAGFSVTERLLVTTLQSTSAMLKALAVLRDILPDNFQLPITTDMMVNILALIERIEDQVGNSK